ncbi:porin [Pyxidicoccus parkwayensis]|uniref:Porin n=1 Tax=Pyxidicoccus parkwayensis TaxID=2813578 RepID=A0ABX7P2X9_9BACT|nr:porin [Pyxidicoccus parkwaysis]QSQ24806.1 porin [Pyxidicoccus parkwaysis]
MEGAATRSVILSLGLLVAPLASAQSPAPEASAVQPAAAAPPAVPAEPPAVAPPATPGEPASAAPSTASSEPAVAAPPTATAEPTAPPASAKPATPTSSEVIIKASSEGFSLSSPDKAFVLKLRGYLQTDLRLFASVADRPGSSTFLARRARPLLEGTVYGAFDFRLLLDFAAGAPALWDAYVEYKPSKALRLRAGKAKPAVGLERLQSATNIIFLERALPTNLVPNRDIGLQLQGELAGGALSYALGAYNGAPDGASTDTNLEDSFDLIARVFAQPFKAGGPKQLSGLGVGVAATNGQAFGSATSTGLSVLRTTGQQTFFSYRTGATAAEAVVAHGNHFRFTPQGYFYAGPLGVLAEYVSSAQEVAHGADHTRLRHTSWQATASFVLFGGDAAYDGVKPRTPFKSGDGWGAVEVAGRYSELHVDPDAFPIYADPTRSAHDAADWGVGANWYLNSNIRVAANFDHTSFEGGAAEGDRVAEDIFISRFQVSW